MGLLLQCKEGGVSMNNGRHVRHESTVERKLDKIIELLEKQNKYQLMLHDMLLGEEE